jgi:hypothetical protein
MKVRTLALAAVVGMIMFGGSAFAQTKPAKPAKADAAAADNAGMKKKAHKHRKAHKVRAAKKDDAAK